MAENPSQERWQTVNFIVLRMLWYSLTTTKQFTNVGIRGYRQNVRFMPNICLEEAFDAATKSCYRSNIVSSGMSETDLKNLRTLYKNGDADQIIELKGKVQAKRRASVAGSSGIKTEEDPWKLVRTQI